MKILVQSSKRSSAQLEMEYEAIKRSGHEYVNYGILLNDGKFRVVGLENIDTDEICYNRCPTQFYDRNHLMIGDFPNSFLTSVEYNHDTFMATSPPADECNINLYPGRHRVMRLIEAMHITSTETMFMKPNNDRKLFNGTVVKPGETLGDLLGVYKKYFEHINSEVLVSMNHVEIMEEVRCYVVNKKVITASRYHRNGKFDMSYLDDWELYEWIEMAQFFVDNYYAPGNNFTIDLCTTRDGLYKIVEYNALNSSGLYNCDSRLLFDTLENYLKG